MKSIKIEKEQKLVVFRPKGVNVSVEVQLKDESVWLTQKQMALLFEKDVRTVNEHILNIFKEKELRKTSVIRNFRITAADGKKYKTAFYNLDMIISVVNVGTSATYFENIEKQVPLPESPLRTTP